MTHFLALFRQDGSEPSAGAGYARAEIGSGRIKFPKATSSWGVVTSFGIFEDATLRQRIVAGRVTSIIAGLEASILPEQLA